LATSSEMAVRDLVNGSLPGSRISAMTRFDKTVLPRFSLPRTLPD
jgi:hypothetical protein